MRVLVTPAGIHVDTIRVPIQNGVIQAVGWGDDTRQWSLFIRRGVRRTDDTRMGETGALVTVRPYNSLNKQLRVAESDVFDGQKRVDMGPLLFANSIYSLIEGVVILRQAMLCMYVQVHGVTIARETGGVKPY